ncbi:MAG: hypothetical protein ABF273_01960 [Wenyingzhuangia sp.]|uniref:hypothetical protein n=1 Tax=Wenyingzhuangia sp. TaxID=1964193 RepID=UPI00321B4F06
MKVLKLIFQFYVHSNLHVSLAAASLVLSSGFLFGFEVYSEAVFVMCATFVSYHFIRLMNRFKYGQPHLLDIFSNQYKIPIYILFLIAFTFGLCLSVKFEFFRLLYLCPFLILTMLYAFSFIGKNGVRYSIRFIPGIKIFVIAIVWAGSVIFFPITSSIGYNHTQLVFFFGLVFFIIVLTLPFDIRDMSFDENTIKTLPMLLGIVGVKCLGFILLVFSLALHFYVFEWFCITEYSIVCSMLFVLLVFSKREQTKFFASFWVESIPIFYYALLCL